MNDPTVLLINEHHALQKQLDLLECTRGDGDKITSVLRALMRDSSVHFQRENALIEMLSSELGAGGEPLKSLSVEHENFAQEIRCLIKMITPPQGYPPFLVGPGVKEQFRVFVEKFRTHMCHEETVVYLLAKTRLTPEQLRTISHKILAL